MWGEIKEEGVMEKEKEGGMNEEQAQGGRGKAKEI